MFSEFQNLDRFRTTRKSFGDLNGKLLLASPFMADSYFAGTVIFICAHSQSAGTIGFILNKPVEESADQLIEDWLERASGPRMVFTGGPVDSENVVGVAKRTEQSALNPAFIHLTADVDAVDLDDLSAGDLNTGTPLLPETSMIFLMMTQANYSAKCSAGSRGDSQNIIPLQPST